MNSLVFIWKTVMIVCLVATKRTYLAPESISIYLNDFCVKLRGPEACFANSVGSFTELLNNAAR